MGGSVESLEAALRDGVITQEQYDALVARLGADRETRLSEDLRRRLVGAGLLLLGAFVVFLALTYLSMGQRLALVSAALVATSCLAVMFWRDPAKVDLSRGLLGLGMFEAMLVLLLARWERYLGLEAHVGALVVVAGFGAILGIVQNSTWLASPSFLALYVGLVTAGLPVGSDFLVGVLLFSVVVAAGVVGLVWAWRRGALKGLHDAYVRRQRALGQLARGHLVLFDLYLPIGLSALLIRPPVGVSMEAYAVIGLAPFLVALVAVLYARAVRDPKLLTSASLLMVAVAWVPWARSVVLPVAILVTAGVLIYLGIQRRRPMPTSKSA